ncbi:AMP-binding protein [Rhizorhabdus wittichii]|uniref:AMP-binding protein n=1 Tax=Rhizorhabdus wittichii TaxID=160791 RepID=UPI000364C45A|nr:AMP-binding protein [Rhizorhabdus wittichii]
MNDKADPAPDGKYQPASLALNSVPVSDAMVPIGTLPTFHAMNEPNRPAITCESRTVSYRELDVSANRRARALAARGVGVDDFVIVALPNSVEFYETIFAIWKLGATPIPVSAKLPIAELTAILDLVRPRVVVGLDPAMVAGFDFMPGDHPVDGSLSAEPLEPKIATHWKGILSGGSTGRPKVILDHHPGIWDPNVPATRQRVGETLLSMGPLYHNAGFTCMSIGLFTGGHIVEMGKFDPLRALELIERHRVGWVNFVPTMMHRIWRLPEEQRDALDLSSLHTVFHMGSACPAWLKEKWIEWIGGERIWELYGGTERTGQTIINGEEWLAHKGSVGKVQPGARLRILDDKLKDCPPNEIGEIFFLPDGGRNSTYHYLGAEPRSVGDWQSLGDLGHMDEDGYLYIVDRRTDLIISGGVNVYPAEIEAALDAHPLVGSSIVIGLPDGDLGHIVHALVELVPQNASVSPEDLQDFLKTRLARNKIPRSFEFMDRPLRDDAGKARRSALRDERIAGMATAESR